MDLELEYSDTILFKASCIVQTHLYHIHIQIYQYHDINFKLRSIFS